MITLANVGLSNPHSPWRVQVPLTNIQSGKWCNNKIFLKMASAYSKSTWLYLKISSQDSQTLLYNCSRHLVTKNCRWKRPNSADIGRLHHVRRKVQWLLPGCCERVSSYPPTMSQSGVDGLHRWTHSKSRSGWPLTPVQYHVETISFEYSGKTTLLTPHAVQCRSKWMCSCCLDGLLKHMPVWYDKYSNALEDGMRLVGVGTCKVGVTRGDYVVMRK